MRPLARKLDLSRRVFAVTSTLAESSTANLVSPRSNPDSTMVLAKLFSAKRSRLAPRQVLSLADLDLRLDVTSDRFMAAVNRLIEQFSVARASLDLAAYRAERAKTDSPAALPDFPDFRDSG